MEHDFSPLSSLEHRYPEKTNYLGCVFGSTTNSYKYFWLLAILERLKIGGTSRIFRISDLISEMFALAWHPVALYRLNLGESDRLGQFIEILGRQIGLLRDASESEIRNVLKAETSKSLLDKCDIDRYVPQRFLTPWFAPELKGLKDYQKDLLVSQRASVASLNGNGCFYRFVQDGNHPAILIEESWASFVLENMTIVKAFAEHNLIGYLQRRNPNVPGVVNKLHAPEQRDLSLARKFWKKIIEHNQRIDPLTDIYSNNILNTSGFHIDHFLPWSFVVHDQIWNLVPVEGSSNVHKSDNLPCIERYLPSLALVHFRTIRAFGEHNVPNRLKEEYCDCFKLSFKVLTNIDSDKFEKRYFEIISPLAQMAVNMGFIPNWEYRP